MQEKPLRETYDTGLKKIRLEIKSRLVPHGLYGVVTEVDSGPQGGEVPEGSTIEIAAQGRTVVRLFDRKQVEGCHLRVGGEVLTSIIAMIEEISAPARVE